MVIVRTYIKYSIDTIKMSMAMMKLLTKTASANIGGEGKQASSSQKNEIVTKSHKRPLGSNGTEKYDKAKK
jgi:hypothetical protein